MSCAGNGYLSGNTLVAFPFEDGQCLGWESGDPAHLQQALQGCFADAGIHLRAQSVSPAEWPSIGGFSADGDSLSFILKAGGEEVPLSVSGLSNAKFPIVSGSGSWGSYVLVLSSEGIADFCRISPPARSFSRSSPAGSEGTSLRLCAKCVTFSPASLESVKVFDGWHAFEDGPHFTLSGDVCIKPGCNMRLSKDGTGMGVVVDPDVASIELDAEPGAGLGRIPCRCSGGSKGSLKSLAGPDGHLRLFNDTCYDLEPNTKTGEIRMHAKCTACCTCDMYANIVNGKLLDMANAVRQAKSDLRSMLDEYESSVKKFNDRMSSPDMSDMSLTLAGMPIGAGLSPSIRNRDVKGRMQRCVFTATFRNTSYFQVSARVVGLSGTDDVVESSAAWSDEAGNPLSSSYDSAAGLTSASFAVYPGRSLAITFVSAKRALVSSVVTGGYSGSISMDVFWNGGRLGSLSKSVSA